MKQLILFLQQRLSLRLGLLIVFIITVGFSLLFGLLFQRGKQYLHRAAIERAEQMLENTVARINGIMDETEFVANNLAASTPHHLYPDSLLVFSRRAVVENEFLTGMAISMEPYYFPQMGRYFSAYTVRQDDTITTVREGPFEYFEKIWYKTPRTLGVPCWVDCFDDYNEGTLSAHDILTSYCCPMRDDKGRYVGNIIASLTLKWLSQSVTNIRPYPNSSAIMIDRKGTYIVHPDTTKLFRETIFSDAAPESRQDIERLGKTMLAGRSGMMQTTVDGKDSYILYRPLERAGWSIAIVCPATDVFSRYNQLVVTVWSIIGIGLLVLLLFCFLTISRGLQPLEQLTYHAQRIADGHFDEQLAVTSRRDSVGRLTNSIVHMQQSLSEAVTSIQNDNAELERRNKELARAYQMKIDADEEKTAFLQNMSHQIRTPLNIICGFTQVLTSSRDDLPKEELEDIIFRIMSSAKAISHISHLITASSLGGGNNAFSTFSCNGLCREAVASVTITDPNVVSIAVDSSFPDDFMIHSDRQALLSILIELLDNASKFTKKGCIVIGCRLYKEDAIAFTVSNPGAEIPSKARDHIFVPFTKLDSFSEGVGLGLSISRHAARHLGGDLIYDESYRGGTRFILTIGIKNIEKKSG